MCRWLAYFGNPIRPETLLYDADHSLVEQSRRDRLAGGYPNADGFGLGWYGNREVDSELMFHLALTFGLDEEPLGALERMAGFVEETGRRHGVEEPLQMRALPRGRALLGVQRRGARNRVGAAWRPTRRLARGAGRLCADRAARPGRAGALYPATARLSR